MKEKRIMYLQHVLSVFSVTIALDGEQPQENGEVASVPMDSLLSPLEEHVDEE